MEITTAQLITDSAISGNWVVAGILMIAIWFQKRANDKADQREKKIDSILEAQQKQLSDHDRLIALHELKLEMHDKSMENFGHSTMNLSEQILMKLDLLKEMKST